MCMCASVRVCMCLVVSVCAAVCCALSHTFLHACTLSTVLADHHVFRVRGCQFPRADEAAQPPKIWQPCGLENDLGAENIF